MREIAEQLGSAEFPVPVSEEEREESRQLLEWLADDHFTFLGCRDYELVHEGDVEAVRPVPGTGLGIMRDGGEPTPEPAGGRDGARGQGPVREARLLNLTKTGAKATVHRRRTWTTSESRPSMPTVTSTVSAASSAFSARGLRPAA